MLRIKDVNAACMVMLKKIIGSEANRILKTMKIDILYIQPLYLSTSIATYLESIRQLNKHVHGNAYRTTCYLLQLIIGGK